MAYKDPQTERACQRRCYRRVTDERLANDLCPKCGKAVPEPDRRLCRRCGEKRRAADRARYARAKAAGLAYGGGNVEAKRKAVWRDNLDEIRATNRMRLLAAAAC